MPSDAVRLAFDGAFSILVKEVFRAIEEINAKGTTVLLVEQNANMALKIANRGYVLENGRVALEGSAGQLVQDSRVKEAYLGNGKPNKNQVSMG